jgi:hypothetical protein
MGKNNMKAMTGIIFFICLLTGNIYAIYLLTGFHCFFMQIQVQKSTLASRHEFGKV